MFKPLKKKSTEEQREFWAFIEETAKDVEENFPLWKVSEETAERFKIRRDKMFELITFDDWEVLLKDGELVYEQHTVPSCACLPCCLEYASKQGITKDNLSSREATKREYELIKEYGNWGRIPKWEFTKL